jgi:thymidylate synthase (FAD)
MLVRTIRPEGTIMTSAGSIQSQFLDCARFALISHGKCYEEAAEQIQLVGEAASFLSKLISRPIPHESVLEHGSLSVRITCSRIGSHQIVRHRLCAFTQESTRYVLSTRDDTVTFMVPGYDEESNRDLMPLGKHITQKDEFPIWLKSSVESAAVYQYLLSIGKKREEARYILPQCLATTLYMTANFREWRHVFKLRTDRAASPELQYIFGDVKKKLSVIVPEFQW